MIDFSRFELDNGLRVIVHEDTSTPMAAVNVLYNVGSREIDSDMSTYQGYNYYLIGEIDM